MVEWMTMPLKRYADFSGRSRRKEYWMYVLGLICVSIVLTMIDRILGMGGMIFGVYGPLTALLAVATFIPSLAVMVRRFHDQDKSGWFALLVLIPFLGALIALVFMLLEGTKGENRFGPDPKGGEIAATRPPGVNIS